MENSIKNEQIKLYKSLFRGRDDIFATRWEKEGKSGYMPAYHFDRYHLKLHKMKGGTFQSFQGKTHLPITDEQILKHLNGDQLVGVYPLLKDNTSWFIAADFDESNWEEECRKFLRICTEKNFPAYLERSRSGKGGHVWIFFDRVYPAIKSRRIVISMLEKAGVFSVFDKTSSFDRLFPNQDFLSGKGFGNLIALPFHKPAMQQANSCFIDPETLTSYEDQWAFLRSIQRVPVSLLDELYTEIEQNGSVLLMKPNISGRISIVLKNNVLINRSGLPRPLVNFLKEELNFANAEYIIKKKVGRNTWGTKRYFKFVEEKTNAVILPRGFAGKLLRFCKENKIEHEFEDQRKKLPPSLYKTNFQLRDHQKAALEASAKKDFGVFVAPPGSGKTVLALKIIAEKQQPALIIVHRKQLLEQWIERIQAFLGIPKHEIGKIGQGKGGAGKQITVAMIQSLGKALDKDESGKLQSSFGTIIVDECHHVPAETFHHTISKLDSYYLYGLTATPFRKYSDGKLIFIHLGEVISELKAQDMGEQKRAEIIIRNTDLDIPYNAKTDRFETLSKILVHDSSRNKLIMLDVVSELSKGRKCIIITERKEHINTLCQFLKQSYETVALSGDDSEADRNIKWKILKEGSYQVLVTTGKFFGEGTDLQNAQCLFLVYPFAFQGKLIQYIGRVQRSEIAPVIYDYRDIKIDYLNKLFLKRNTYYRKFIKQATLFDEPDEITLPTAKETVTIEQTVNIPIQDLEFRYGAVAFKLMANEMNKELEFEIDHSDMRPEFEVLKPYFIKQLGKKSITTEISAEFEQGILVSQLATSLDLEKINREIIDSVKFRFVSKNLFGKAVMPDGEQNLLDIGQLQSGQAGTPALYDSEEALLQDVLKNGNYRHYKQLKYLAERHDSSILKVRFVLNPFSFAFLLSGREQFHVVLETLDTEEATYVWHVDKNMEALQGALNRIDKDLNLIRNKGRQAFLGCQVENFSRIIHDYSDERKGFVLWKDFLEERVV